MSKILIVEDDNFLLEMLAKAGSQEGLNIEIATNGEEGFKKIKEGNFDLVLLDLILPKMHGLELLENLNTEKNTTPIIVLSNLYDQESVDKAKSFGVKDYIIKAQTTPKEIIEKANAFLLANNKPANESGQ